MFLLSLPTAKRRVLALLSVLLVAVLLSACGNTASPEAPAAAAPAAVAEAPAAEAAPAQIAMAAAPQILSPEAYNEDFLGAGAGYQLIDVRTPEEFNSGHIAGAVNIPLQEIAGRLGEISQQEPVVVYCRSGNRSAQAATLLQQAGYTGIYDLGGVIGWEAAGYPLE